MYNTILLTIVTLCTLDLQNLFILHDYTTYSLTSRIHTLFSLANYNHSTALCFYEIDISDSTYDWEYAVFAFLYLAYFTYHIYHVHPVVTNDRISFFFLRLINITESVYVWVCVCVCVCSQTYSHIFSIHSSKNIWKCKSVQPFWENTGFSSKYEKYKYPLIQ